MAPRYEDRSVTSVAHLDPREAPNAVYSLVLVVHLLCLLVLAAERLLRLCGAAGAVLLLLLLEQLQASLSIWQVLAAALSVVAATGTL